MVPQEGFEPVTVAVLSGASPTLLDYCGTSKFGSPGGIRTHSVRRRYFLRVVAGPIRQRGHTTKTWRVRVESNHRLMVLQTIALALGHALMVGYPGFEPGKMTRSLGPPLCLISPVAHKTKAPISRGSSISGLLKHHVYMPRSRNGEPALSNDERQ